MSDARQLASLPRTRALAGDLSPSTLRRLVAAGEFPAPVVLSRTKAGKPCRIAWVEEEVLVWCANRTLANRGEAR